MNSAIGHKIKPQKRGFVVRIQSKKIDAGL